MNARFIDLTLPIDDHFRWPVDRRLLQDYAQGDQFQTTWMGWSLHGFTHVDAPLHVDPGGLSVEDIPLETLAGEAALVDLTGVGQNTPIEAAELERAGDHVRAGDIVLLKTGLESIFPPITAEYWTDAPWVTRGAAEWLLRRGVKAVGYDFPQDFVIREFLHGGHPPAADFVTHDVLLRRGIPQIEYLSNLTEVTARRIFVLALPLKIAGADGAPARVVALVEGGVMSAVADARRARAAVTERG